MKKVVILLLLSSLFQSCDKQELAFIENKTLKDKSLKLDGLTIRDDIYRDIAMRIASQLQNKEISSYLKTRASNRFDGETNFLIIAEKDKKFNTLNSNFKKLFISEKYENYIEQEFPLTHFYINSGKNYKSFDEINMDNENLLVGFVPLDKTIDFIPAYDRKGNLIKLSKEGQPLNPTIIIAENERTIILDKNIKYNKLPKLYSSKTFDIVLKTDLYNFENNEILSKLKNRKGLKIANTSSCTRDNNSFTDRFNEFKFNTSSAYNAAKDGWFNGTLEIEANITIGGTPTFTLKKKWDIWEGHLKDLNYRTLWDVDILNWNKSIYGDAYKVSWLEDDGGGTSKRTSSFTTTKDGATVSYSNEYTIPGNREDLGDALVQYCNNTDNGGFVYNTGSVSFKIHTPY